MALIAIAKSHITSDVSLVSGQNWIGKGFWAVAHDNDTEGQNPIHN
jgi:hypothetical protein